MTPSTQRDAFWERVTIRAGRDARIVAVSADMGAPALDRFRRDLPHQFVNVGIAEQNALLIAAGLALEGKRPLAYAIAPFITLRCFEQIRVECGIMGLPVVVVGVGAGFGYDDSGPTHHMVEDLSALRALPGLTIFSVSDAVQAAAVADLCLDLAGPSYVRLDRPAGASLYPAGADFSKGFSVLREGRDAVVVATGAMVRTALAVAAALTRTGRRIGVIDLHRFPVDAPALLSALGRSRPVFTLEEHVLAGGLGSYLLEIANDRGARIAVERIGLAAEKAYCYVYGGRGEIHRRCGLDPARIGKRIASRLG